MSDIAVSMDGPVPKEVMELAEALAERHGVASIHQGARGIHIHIPDPAGLENEGVHALDTRKLQINAEMYLGIGRYDIDRYPTAENRKLWNTYRSKGLEVPCCYCQKTGKKNYSVAELLRYKPISQRGLGLGSRGDIMAVKTGVSDTANLVDDGTGTMVPAPCGKTVPLTSLPADHPAVVYLRQRRFDPAYAERVYGISYCIEAAPESRAKGIYYGLVAPGLRNTYTGRIIIPIRVDGHTVGCQGRCIDALTSDGEKIVYDGSRWVYVGDGTKKLRKYLNVVGMSRNDALFGFDQADLWNTDNGYYGANRRCVLVEGPLDALRVGPPAIAILGAHLSPRQASRIADKFGRVIIAGDNDNAGRKAVESIMQALEGAGMNMAMVDRVTVPSGKDLGDMETQAALSLVRSSSVW